MTKQQRENEKIKIHPQMKFVNEIKFVGMDSKKKPDLQRILNVVCDTLDVDSSKLKSKSRKSDLVKARHCFFYLASISSKHYTLSKIGSFLNKDHATVLHGKRKISKFMDVYEEDLILIIKMKKILSIFDCEYEYENSVATTEAHVGYYDTPEKIQELRDRLMKK